MAKRNTAPKNPAKPTIPTSTKTSKGRPKARPIIKIPASHPPSAEVMNENPVDPNPPPVDFNPPPVDPNPPPVDLNPPPVDPNPPPAPNHPEDPLIPVSAPEASAPIVADLDPQAAPRVPTSSTAASGPTRATNPVFAKKSATSTTIAIAEEATLAAKYAKALELDRFKKQESATKIKDPQEVKRPSGRITDLQKAMGLEDDRALYISCRATVRDVMASAGIKVNQVWRKQEPLILAKITALAKSRNPQLGHYEHGWATLEIMRTTMKNKRNYNKKIGRSTDEPDNDGAQVDMDSDDEEFTDSGGEGGTNDAGKRKKVADGSTRKKARI